MAKRKRRNGVDSYLNYAVRQAAAEERMRVGRLPNGRKDAIREEVMARYAPHLVMARRIYALTKKLRIKPKRCIMGADRRMGRAALHAAETVQQHTI